MKVLLVEDEEAYIDALTIALSAEGFEVAVATDGGMAVEMFDSVDPDVVLLDWMLPRLTGVEVCKQLRAKSSVPILMLTAKSSEIDTVVALEVGADDYITKPYRMRELLARMKAVMRRSEDAEASGSDDEIASDLTVGDVSINLDSREVNVRNEQVSLPLKEFELLNYLMSNAGRVLTRDQLIERVWGHDYFGETKTLDVHIKRLRSKIETVPSKPSRIVTVRGVGYKYDGRDSVDSSSE